MECTDIRRHLSEYIDNECPEEIRASVAAHLQTCPECRQKYEQLLALSRRMRALPRQELPFDFTAALDERIREEERRQPRRKPVYKRPWARVMELCACLLLVVGVVTLGGNMFHMGASAPADMAYTTQGSSGDYSGDYRDYSNSMEMPETEEAVAQSEDAYAADSAASASSLSESSQAAERKIVMNWYLDLQVDDLDAAFSEIERIAYAHGGYTVSGSSSGAGSGYRDGFISVRVEAEQARQAVEEISALGEVRSSQYSSEDVTSDYYDTSARLTAYEAQEQRLLELYGQAASVTEMLEIEQQLTSVRAQIESLQGALNYYDRLTALSLIEISLYQPGTYTQTVEPQGWQGFVTKLKSSFLTGLNNTLDGLAGLLTALARALPFLILAGLILFLLIRLIRRTRRPKK